MDHFSQPFFVEIGECLMLIHGLQLTCMVDHKTILQHFKNQSTRDSNNCDKDAFI